MSQAARWTGRALLALSLMLVPVLGACDWPYPPVVGDGFVDETAFRARQLEFLQYATTGAPSFDSPTLALSYLARTRAEPGWDPGFTFPQDAFASSFAKIENFEDTADFGALYLLNILLDFRGHPMLPQALVDRIESTLLGMKMWYDQPTPPGVIDNNYYWSENHQIIFHTIEYLLGQEYPDEIFPNDGRTGREHMAHARALMEDWFDLRARFGFTEWHSDVYYQKDVVPLATLVEFADDPEVRTKAAMVLDLVLFDLAAHSLRGNNGVTHGRSYKKDKTKATDQDVFGVSKLLFDETSLDWNGRSEAGATFLAKAQRYRLPEAILRIAKSREVSVDRNRMSVPLDEFEPITANPQHPLGLSYDDLPLWWGAAALTAWQVVPLTLSTFNQFDLWETEHFRDFQPLRDLVGENVPLAQAVALGLARVLSFGLLTEVNTYTYRTPDFMLSTAQDWRKGSRGYQNHSWQATFDERAIVFTTHPGRLPPVSSNWGDDNEPGPSYWTGEASNPRSAQHENVAIHIYAPQYLQMPPPATAFSRYENFTHAYFPQDRFDEVVRDGHWTFGRRGEGWIALYSWRTPEWLDYAGTGLATDGMVQPFDLRAPGGPDNVWIVECARASDWNGDFAAFRAAVLGSRVEVTSLGAPPAGAASAGFSVVYESPSQGLVRFGWNEDFEVAGEVMPLSDYPRLSNPWAEQPYDSHRVVIMDEPSLGTGHGVAIDFEQGTRKVFGPAPAQP